MRIETGVDGDKDLLIDLSGMESEGAYRRNNGTVSLVLREEEVMQLRDRLESYLDGRRVEFKKFWEKSREPAPPAVQRVSLETMRDIFTDLAESKEPFFCVFEKQDGSIREMNARMIGPVQYSYKTRSSYANVIDLDIQRERIVAALKANDPKLCEGSTYERKIVLSRVSEVSGKGFYFISNGR